MARPGLVADECTTPHQESCGISLPSCATAPPRHNIVFEVYCGKVPAICSCVVIGHPNSTAQTLLVRARCDGAHTRILRVVRTSLRGHRHTRRRRTHLHYYDHPSSSALTRSAARLPPQRPWKQATLACTVREFIVGLIRKGTLTSPLLASPRYPATTRQVRSSTQASGRPELPRKRAPQASSDSHQRHHRPTYPPSILGTPH